MLCIQVNLNSLMDNVFIYNIATIENPNYYRNIVNNLSNCSCELVIEIEKQRQK